MLMIFSKIPLKIQELLPVQTLPILTLYPELKSLVRTCLFLYIFMFGIASFTTFNALLMQLLNSITSVIKLINSSISVVEI